jgi:glycosyltransferase involved in cell wall biosynthesis
LKHWAINRMAARFVYRRANAIVAVSEGVRSEILELFNTDPSRVVTIYNPVIPNGFESVRGEARHLPGQPFSIVAMGRLAREKGFDVLIEAMANVPMPWQLDIWGEGPDRPLLEKMIAERNMTSAIRLRGYTADPFGVLAAAELFVLSSRHEGLPTVLIEALACACRVVAADCPHGPSEILLDGRLGRLVPPENPDALAEAIIREIRGNTSTDVDLRRKRVEEFTVTRAGRRWLSLLKETR